MVILNIHFNPVSILSFLVHLLGIAGSKEGIKEGTLGLIGQIWA